MRIEQLRERITIQRNDAPTISVSSITRSSTTATVTTGSAHGFLSTDYVTLAGATQTAYNAKFKITVTGTTTFTFTVTGSPATPATGTITAVYTSNAVGGLGVNFWRTLATVWAEMMPLKASERLQLAAIQSDTLYRFRIRLRSDVDDTMRLLWTPSWPADATQQTLVITGVIHDRETTGYQVLETAVAA